MTYENIPEMRVKNCIFKLNLFNLLDLGTKQNTKNYFTRNLQNQFGFYFYTLRKYYKREKTFERTMNHNDVQHFILCPIQNAISVFTHRR